MDPVWQRVLELAGAILLASTPGVVSLIQARRREVAQARKAEAEAEATLSDAALEWAVEFRKDVDAVRCELTTAQKEAAELRAQLAEVRLINERLTNRVKELENANTHLTSQVAALEHEKEALRAEIAQLRKEVGNGNPCSS